MSKGIQRIKNIGDIVRFKDCPPEYKKTGVIRNFFNNAVLVIATERKAVSPGVHRSKIVEFKRGHELSFTASFELHKPVVFD